MADYSLLSQGVPQFQPADLSKALLGGIAAGQNQQQLGIMQQAENRQQAKSNVELPAIEMESKIKQFEVINKVAATAKDPVSWQQALTTANKMGIDVSDAPTNWGPEAQAYAQRAYQMSGQALEQFKIKGVESEINLRNAQATAALDRKPLSNVGKVQSDLAAGMITQNQANQALAGKSTIIYDRETGSPIVQMGGAAPNTQGQGGLTGPAASDLQKQDTKQIGEARKAATDAQAEISEIPALRQALQGFGDTGAFGNMKHIASKIGTASLGVGGETANTGDFIKSASSKIALFNRKNMPGSMSDSDRKFLVDMAPGLDKTPQGNELIMQQAEAQAKRLIQHADFKEKYRIENGSLNGEAAAWGKFMEENSLLKQDKNGHLLSIEAKDADFSPYLTKQGKQQDTSGLIQNTPEVRTQLKQQHPDLSDEQLSKAIELQNERLKKKPSESEVAQPSKPAISENGKVSLDIHPEVPKVAKALSVIESGGQKNPYATRTQASKGRVALGKYQVLNTNVASWTKEFMGKAMSVAEFLADPKAQEFVAHAKMNQMWEKYGNFEDIAALWFSGRPAKGNRAYDPYAKQSVPQYLKKAVNIYQSL